MPNHVFNEVRLHGVSLDTIKPLITDKNGKISFRVLVPLPINFWPGSVGSQHQEAFPGTHLDAATKTWGTKWDCYGNPDAVQDGEDTLITFQTAWNPPRGWIVALFNTLECRITAKWQDEGRSDAFTETYSMDSSPFGGPDWKTEAHIEGSDEQRRLHKCMWGVEAFDDEDHAAALTALQADLTAAVARAEKAEGALRQISREHPAKDIPHARPGNIARAALPDAKDE